MGDFSVGRGPASEARRALEAAGARVFAERGYAAATVDDIVAAAALSKPMLYRHFSSKKALFLHLIEAHGATLAAAALAPLRDENRLLEDRLAAGLDAWFRHIEDRPFVARLLFGNTGRDPDILAAYRALHDAQRANDIALLRAFIPGLSDDQLQPLGEAIRSALTGLALWWLDHPKTPRQTLVAAMLRLTRGLVLDAQERGEAP